MQLLQLNLFCFNRPPHGKEGQDQKGNTRQTKQQQGRPLACSEARKALPQGYRGKRVFPMQVDAEMAYLPDAGGTVIKEAVLSRRGPFIALGLG